MRALVTLLAAGTLIGGCACSEMDLIGLPVENDGGVASETTAPVTTRPVTPRPDTRMPGGWWVSPTAPGMCTSPTAAGVEIPCSVMMNICTDEPNPTNRLMPAVYYCTTSSPTWRDVCATRPPEEWEFYAISREDCASITAPPPADA